MRSSSVCSSIEAEKIELQCRKFSPQRPRKDSRLSKTVYPFKLSIYGIARVLESYPEGRELYRSVSLKEGGDEINGEALDGFSFRPLGRPEVRNATHTHKASFIQCVGGVYVHVEIGNREQLAESDPAPTLSTGADEGWQYAAWGMTKDEVMSASQGAAVAADAQEQAQLSVQSRSSTVLLKAPYCMGRFSLMAYFVFDDATGKLARVRLTLADPITNAPAFENQLRALYGAPGGSRGNSSEDSELTWSQREGSDICFLRLACGTPGMIAYLDYSHQGNLVC